MREDPHGKLIIDTDGVLMLDIPGLTRRPLIAPPVPPSPAPVEPPTGIADATVDSGGVVHFPDGFFVVRVTTLGAYGKLYYVTGSGTATATTTSATNIGAITGIGCSP